MFLFNKNRISSRNQTCMLLAYRQEIISMILSTKIGEKVGYWHDKPNYQQKMQKTLAPQHNYKIHKVQTHSSSVSIELFTLTVVFQFFFLDPVCRSQSPSVFFSAPHEPHLHTTLEQSQILIMEQRKKKTLFHKQTSVLQVNFQNVSSILSTVYTGKTSEKQEYLNSLGNNKYFRSLNVQIASIHL